MYAVLDGVGLVIAGWFICHAISSVSLLVLNRAIGLQYGFPFNVVFLQNAASLILSFPLIKTGILPIHSIELRHLFECIPSALMFVTMLWSSLECLVRTSVPVVIVIRNLTPICVAMLEHYLFGVYFPSVSYIALGLVSIGTCIFFWKPLMSSRIDNLNWMILYSIVCVTLPILEKLMYRRLQSHQTNTGILLYRNGLSLLVIFLVAPLLVGTRSFVEGFIALFRLEWGTLILLMFSCVGGFSIGLAYFFLVGLVPVTYLAVANAIYKLCSLAISVFVWGIDFNLYGIIGLFLSFTGAFLFIPFQSKKLLPQSSPTAENGNSA
jgi:drug/metabolite transporter (DMT)-like permease